MYIICFVSIRGDVTQDNDELNDNKNFTYDAFKATPRVTSSSYTHTESTDSYTQSTISTMSKQSLSNTKIKYGINLIFLIIVVIALIAAITASISLFLMILNVNSGIAVAQANVDETVDQISDIDRLIMRIETSRITADEKFAEVNNQLSSTINRIDSNNIELEIFTALNLIRTDGVIIDRLDVSDDNILELIRNSPTFQS